MTLQADGKAPLWITARQLLCERGDDFSRRLDQALQTFDPEDIHDLRVSSRRAREGLLLFAPCYPAGRINRLGKQLKRVTRLLGSIRNSDEAALYFSSLRNQLEDSCGGELEQLAAAFRKTREEELQRLGSGLEQLAAGGVHGRYRRVVAAPALFAGRAGSSDAFAPVAGFACEALTTRFADVVKLVPPARQEQNSKAQHLLRIAVKHCRYRLEILSFLLASDYPEVHAALKGYQDVLGKMHDLDVFAGICREASLPPPRTALIQAAIATDRDRFFADFSAMLETIPFEGLVARVRAAL
jgi:CHAD domain-containing protein